jgi:uncharacterized membrane protein
MIREKLIEKGIGNDHQFRWRSHEVSRTEGLSDAVFGFAITLLVVSLEVPKTYAELMQTMRGFGAFAISFTLLFLVWYNQYKFFRRYGLQDNTTMVLNGILLFVVIFYVYPLKFVFTLLVNQFSGGQGEFTQPNGSVGHMVESSDQVARVMLIFGVGYVAVFGVFALLYGYAYRRRRDLELNELEEFDTRVDISESLLNVLIGSVSILIAAVGGARFGPYGGFVYMACPLVLSIHGTMMGRKRRKLENDFDLARPGNPAIR